MGSPVGGLPQTAAVVQLQEWAAELSAAHQLGAALAASNFLPKGLCELSNGARKSEPQLAADAAAVILAGKSVGLDPMQSVQNIFPVYGMPSMYARTMGALVIAQGHEVRRTSATDEAVTYSVRRKGDADWQSFTWTIERAKKAEYTKNKKYQSDPIAMLGAKALSEACRVVFSDILLGMPYSVEEMELEDMGEVPAPKAKAEPVKTGAKATVKRRTAPAPALPDVVNQAPTPEPEVATVEMASPEQITHLIVALKAAGHITNEAKAAAVQEQVGRTLGGFQDLTVDEAAGLVDFFNQEVPQAAEPTVLDPAADAAWLAGQTA